MGPEGPPPRATIKIHKKNSQPSDNKIHNSTSALLSHNKLGGEEEVVKGPEGPSTPPERQ